MTNHTKTWHFRTTKIHHGTILEDQGLGNDWVLWFCFGVSPEWGVIKQSLGATAALGVPAAAGNATPQLLAGGSGSLLVARCWLEPVLPSHSSFSMRGVLGLEW